MQNDRIQRRVDCCLDGPDEVGASTLRAVIDREPASLALQIALSRRLLSTVASGCQPETFRVYRTGPAVAFGPADSRHTHYRAAVNAARREAA
jgi:hypothetical protein